MKELSVFDIIGPNMIGPSSSHTAGALRIALLASKMLKAPIEKVSFLLYGSFAKTYKGHGTDKALLGGILGFHTEDPRIKESFQYAEQRKIAYEFIEQQEEKNVHPNTVDIIIVQRDGKKISVRGESIGGGAAVIRKINGVDVKFTGEYSTIVIEQLDKKGVLAYITQCLSECNINIAFMKLYREKKGQTAYTIIEADQKISDQVVEMIKKLEDILDATLIEL